MGKQSTAGLLVLLMLLMPLTGSIGEINHRDGWYSLDAKGVHWAKNGANFHTPSQVIEAQDELPWWERTELDSNRNGVHDSLETKTGLVWVGVSFSSDVTDYHITQLQSIGLEPVDVIESVDAVLLGQISTEYFSHILLIDDVVMIEEYGTVVLWGDVQTQAVKARSNSVYPDGAWDWESPAKES